MLKRVFWPLFLATLAIYATMLVWSLPAISDAAGGLAVFDMRPSGYSLEQARAFLTALPEDATAFYRDVQLNLLDSFYPGLLALSLFLAIGLLAERWIGWWAWLAAIIAIPGSVFDYVENAHIRQMLDKGPDGLTEQLVGNASRYSSLKALFTTAATSVLLVLLALWVWQRFFRHKRAREA
jgi:hypothetical protein